MKSGVVECSETLMKIIECSKIFVCHFGNATNVSYPREPINFEDHNAVENRLLQYADR